MTPGAPAFTAAEELQSALTGLAWSDYIEMLDVHRNIEMRLCNSERLANWRPRYNAVQKFISAKSSTSSPLQNPAQNLHDFRTESAAILRRKNS